MNHEIGGWKTERGKRRKGRKRRRKNEGLGAEIKEKRESERSKGIGGVMLGRSQKRDKGWMKDGYNAEESLKRYIIW